MKYRKLIFTSLFILLISLMGIFTFAQGVGYIQIKCEPGTMVFLDNNFMGNTSSELGGLILQDVPAGSHQIKIVKEGFEPQSVKIDLKVNEIYVYEVKEFIPQLDVTQEGEADTDTIKQRVGSLLVETIPIDCIIEIPKLNINKEHYGNKTKKTWEISNIPIGSYRVNFIALGKKVEYELKIEEGIKKHLLVNILNNEVKEILPIPTEEKVTLVDKEKEVFPTITWDRTWDKTFGGSFEDEAYSLIQTTDGGYAIVGETQAWKHDCGDVWLLKLDSQGNLLWDKTYGGSGFDGARSLIQTKEGGYAVAGYIQSKGAGRIDFWLLKLDSRGNLLWDKTFGGSEDDCARSLIQTKDGGYAVAGYTKSYGAGGRDVWLLKLDSRGNRLWDRTCGGSGLDQAHSLIQTKDGGYAVAGVNSSKGAAGSDVWLIKLDNQGNKVWDKTYGGSKGDVAYSLIQTTDGGYTVAGYTYSKGAGGGDFWLLKLDSRGNRLWDKTYGGSKGDVAYSLIQTAGDKKRGANNQDVWVIKLDEQGDL
jgi:predicted secreted protein